MLNRTVGIWRLTTLATSRNRSSPFTGTSRPTVPTRRMPRGKTGSGICVGSPAPFRITRIWLSRNPYFATSTRFISSETAITDENVRFTRK